MKVETVIFNNSLPEVKKDGSNFRVDFGTVVITLTNIEAVSLCLNILVNKEVRESVFESFKERG